MNHVIVTCKGSLLRPVAKFPGEISEQSKFQEFFPGGFIFKDFSRTFPGGSAFQHFSRRRGNPESNKS
jgi:hypothetical protein